MRCRRASTTRCASRTCASPAIRASSRGSRGQAPRPTRSSSRRSSRSIRRSSVGDVSTPRSSGRRSKSTPADVDRTLEVLRKQRATCRRRPTRRADAATACRRLHRHDRRRRVRGRPGEGLSDRARRRPHAAGVRGRASPGMQAGRDEDVSRSRSRPTITARKSRERQAAVHADGEGGRARRTLPPLDDAFAHAFGIASGKLEDLRSRGRVEPEARAQAQGREPASRTRSFGGAARAGAVPAAEVADRHRGAADDASAWRATCSSRA